MKKDKIRLVYCNIDTFKDKYSGALRLGYCYGMSDMYYLPEGMSKQDACKVISYLYVMNESKGNYKYEIPTVIKMTGDILSKFGFEKIDGGYTRFSSGCCYYYDNMKLLPTPIERAYNKGSSSCTSLFIVSGNFDLFKKTKLYNDYFGWFTRIRVADEIKDIYKKIGKEDLVKDLTNLPSRVCMTERHLPNGEIEVSASLVDCGKIVIGEEKTK